MLIQIHSNLFLYYRLFFIALFLLLGISGVGIVVLEYYAGIDVVTIDSEFEKEALYTTSVVIGILGLTVALIMIFLMQERRSSTSDRRQLARSLDFPDRRSSTDRRSK
ncbi:MAG: hypothetical protein KAJ32_03725 [Gammaproteobacteria bacterium]|nr:hypothetical protein [Gammaproteobacteria bacterium]